MDIRAYQPNDQASVIALWQKCDLAKPQNDPTKDIARKLQVDPDLFLVGVIQGKVVASVMGGYEGHRGWINYLAVDPAQQRKGYGEMMMQTVEVALKAKGCPKINLQVRETNKEVLAFYEAIGYGDDKVVSLGKRLVQDN